MEQQRIFKLWGKLQHYPWGGTEFIPHLLGITPAENKKYAEYWLGAHPSSSSVVDIKEEQAVLHDLIEQDPNTYISTATYRKFQGLPFLLKVLDVSEMLSIQVHPSREEAIKSFEKEEAEGIPIDAPHRNYKDKNHKPEVMVALSEFWLLHGFKPRQELILTLSSVPEFGFLLPIFNQGDYKALYQQVMEMDQSKVDEILLPLIDRIYTNSTTPGKSEPAFWVKKLYGAECPKNKIDRGIFSIYFFNIVHLHPGQAIFQAAGVPHAYLEGQNVELMANSDNVLRGGLTSKHIDVPELLKHVRFEGIRPEVMDGIKINQYQKAFPCPVDDFAISSISLEAGSKYHEENNTAAIFLVIEGKVIADVIGEIRRGEAIYVIPGTDINFYSPGSSQIFKAYLPY
ncbi:MAG: mannose-6-phosphate isomerase, class I [Candidatus Dadabacteria bacterium]